MRASSFRATAARRVDQGRIGRPRKSWLGD